MSHAYVLEAKDELAGIVVRDGRRFRFLSASATFWSLEGSSFRNPRDAERAAAGVIPHAQQVREAPDSGASSRLGALGIRARLMSPAGQVSELPLVRFTRIRRWLHRSQLSARDLRGRCWPYTSFAIPACRSLFILSITEAPSAKVLPIRPRAHRTCSVRASNMSAFPDQPQHFVDWLRQRDDRALRGAGSRRAGMPSFRGGSTAPISKNCLQLPRARLRQKPAVTSWQARLSMLRANVPLSWSGSRTVFA